MKKLEPFRFKKFSLEHQQSAQKIGTDSVLLATWIDIPPPKKILDIGSGCGLISFILAQRFPDAEVLGIEIDQASYLESLENLKSFPWRQRVNFIQGDFLQCKFQNQSFDLIISNPPFFKNSFLSGDAKRDIARHEFSLPHLPLLEKCKSLLVENGTLALVLPTEESEALMDVGILNCNRLSQLKNKPKTSVKRHLTEWNLHKSERNTDIFVLRDEFGNYSKAYKKLGKDYYLNF